MTAPYRYADYTVSYRPLVDEVALGVRRSQRRAGISSFSSKPRFIYGARKTPFADDVVIWIYRMHQQESCHACQHTT